MAQFSIYLISPRGQFNLTNYDSVKGLLLGNTFDEQINLSVDDSSFVFSMLKYRYQGSTKVINELALRVEYGSVIRVEIGGRNYAFSVMNIDYTFLADNLQLTFTCQDTFQACVSKLGIGYTISDDANDSDYLGAQSIDDWAYKIVRDNNVDWTYVSIDSANADAIIRLASDADIAARDNLTVPAAWEAIDAEYVESLRPNPATLNLSVSFSCSDSNAYEALKTLATQNELVIQNDYTTRRFWFEPRKSPIFKGYYVRPDINLQSLSLQGRGENLATVLNITGPTDVDGNEITLVPSLPSKVQAFIESPEWLTSTYYPNLYKDLYSTEAEVNQDLVFLRQIAAVPWLENKLINVDYFKERHLLTYEASDIDNILNNELRIVNGRLMNASRHYFSEQEKWMQTFSKIESEGEIVLGHVVADIQSTYDQVFDISRLKTIKNDSTVHKYATVADFPESSEAIAGNYYYAASTHQVYQYLPGAGYVAQSSFFLSSITWPLFLYLYEDKEGAQYYCAPPYVTNGVRIAGKNVDGSDFTPLTSFNNNLNNHTSFPISAAEKVAYMELMPTGGSQVLSNRLHWPQGIETHVFTSFAEAVRFRDKVLALSSEGVVDLDTFLQERAAKQESLYQLLLENTYKFRQELEQSFDFYVRMHHVGVKTNTDGKIEEETAYVKVGDRINMVDTTTFNQDQINYLYTYFSHQVVPSGGAPDGHATRNEIISTCAAIEGALTQYWQVMRSCGLKLGLFFPATWNCLNILELLQDDFVADMAQPWLASYIDVLLPLTYNSSTQTYSLNTRYAPTNIIPTKGYVYRLKFYDQQRQILQPLKTVYNSLNRSHTNTDANYELVTWTNHYDFLNQAPYFRLYYTTHYTEQLSSVLELYATKTKVQQTVYAPNTSTGYVTIEYTDCLAALSMLCNVYGPPQHAYGFTGWSLCGTYDADRNQMNPTRSLSVWLSRQEIADTRYFTYQVAHNKVWQKLYGNYPGIFRESVYVNETATNTTELYNAAKAQLSQLSQPEFAYNISALDIYMYNQDLLPMNLRIGDQIRIDYQDEPTRFDSVNKALRESLFVTGIRHTLRTDGDYQLTVETRRATDIMVQRFAQLLSGGR